MGMCVKRLGALCSVVVMLSRSLVNVELQTQAMFEGGGIVDFRQVLCAEWSGVNPCSIGGSIHVV